MSNIIDVVFYLVLHQLAGFNTSKLCGAMSGGRYLGRKTTIPCQSLLGYLGRVKVAVIKRVVPAYCHVVT